MKGITNLNDVPFPLSNDPNFQASAQKVSTPGKPRDQPTPSGSGYSLNTWFKVVMNELTDITFEDAQL